MAAEEPAPPVRGPLACRRAREVEVVLTGGLAGSYRAELVRAARQGLAFDPASGEPSAWAASRGAAVTLA
jgi:hypothetical protein